MSPESTRMMENDPELLTKSVVVKRELSRGSKAANPSIQKISEWVGGQIIWDFLASLGSKMEMYKNIQTAG